MLTLIPPAAPKISSLKTSNFPTNTLTLPTGKSLHHSSGALPGKNHGLGISKPFSVSAVLTIIPHMFSMNSAGTISVGGCWFMLAVLLLYGPAGEMRNASRKWELRGREREGTEGCGCWGWSRRKRESRPPTESPESVI